MSVARVFRLSDIITSLQSLGAATSEAIHGSRREASPIEAVLRNLDELADLLRRQGRRQELGRDRLGDDLVDPDHLIRYQRVLGEELRDAASDLFRQPGIFAEDLDRCGV